VQRTAEAENLADEQREEMKIVIVSTQMLISVVNDLLDYTRIQMEKLTLVKQNFDIRNAIREVASLVELQCRHKGLEIVTKIDNFVPEIVYSDPNRLKQILLNLLKNAVRYTFHGTIRLIASITDNHALKFSIKDTGIGLSSHLQSSLQTCFRSSQSDIQSVPSDNALGLYISNILAISLGSTSIEFSSHLGKGSEFSFEICINAEKVSKQMYYSDSTSTEIAEERELECCVHSYNISGGKSGASAGLSSVMIVDDVEFNRVVLRKMLMKLNIRADEAYSGLRAVNMIRAAVRRGHFYRLILMDVEMPEMDGIEATRAIRAMESSGELVLRTKIVACSAHRSREDIERCINAGMDSYLEKPVSNDLLREEVIE
jgi:CheY-like chemotaxis protein